MYLDSKDYQTVWRLAHNWVGADPDKSDPNALSIELKETIHRFMSAAINHAISIRTRRMGFFTDDSFSSYIIEFHHFRKFSKCLRGNEFNKAYLDAIYLKRGDVLRWCQNEFLAPPPFWAEQKPSVPGESTNIANKFFLENRIRDDRLDKLVCQAIARTLWQIDPNIHPAHMAKSKFIQRYGNGKLYTDENTVKNWIAEVDPRKSERKTGRPLKTEYLIDLQTGDLRQ